MSDDSSEIRISKSNGSGRAALVAIISGLLGTGFGASVQGYFNTKLERQKFELSVIEKALEPNDASEAAKRLTFLVDTGIIQSLDGRRIRTYASEKPAELPTLGESPWYVVLASLPGNDEQNAQKVAARIRERTKGVGLIQSIELYKTRISNNFAVVLGGQMSRSEALALAAAARKQFASDAFAQQDRGWTFVKAVSF